MNLSGVFSKSDVMIIGNNQLFISKIQPIPMVDFEKIIYCLWVQKFEVQKKDETTWQETTMCERPMTSENGRVDCRRLYYFASFP